MSMEIFDFNEQPVRVLDREGSPWFVATDVCRVLEIVNTTQALDSLDADERSMQNIGRQGEANIISESGLYALIFKSRKPQAKAFRKWVTAEVLPAIRRTGAYNVAKAVIEENIEEESTPRGLAAIADPITIPTFLSWNHCTRHWSLGDQVRFGKTCLALCKAWGVPYALMGDHHLGMLRAVPMLLAKYVLAQMPERLPDSAAQQSADFERLLTIMQDSQKTEFTCDNLVAICQEEGLFSDAIEASGSVQDRRKRLGRVLSILAQRPARNGLRLLRRRTKRGASFQVIKGSSPSL